MNTHELLIAARKRIERPEHWTQGCEARDKDGNEQEADSSLACKWCGYGAVWAAESENTDPRAVAFAEMALEAACGRHFPSWQDAPERTHAEVLKVFDIAIENTRGEATGETA